MILGIPMLVSCICTTASVSANSNVEMTKCMQTATSKLSFADTYVEKHTSITTKSSKVFAELEESEPKF